MVEDYIGFGSFQGPLGGDWTTNIEKLVAYIDLTSSTSNKTLIGSKNIENDSLQNNNELLQTGAQVRVYPNPIKDEFVNVWLNSVSENAFLYIYDIQGKQVYNKAILQSLTSCAIGDLKKGLYFMIIENGDAGSSHKLLIQ